MESKIKMSATTEATDLAGVGDLLSPFESFATLEACLREASEHNYSVAALLLGPCLHLSFVRDGSLWAARQGDMGPSVFVDDGMRNRFMGVDVLLDDTLESGACRTILHPRSALARLSAPPAETGEQETSDE